MFSGLTNQVSTWIGKKGEDDSVVTEEKVGSPGAGGDLDAEKKDNRYLQNLLILRKVSLVPIKIFVNSDQCVINIIRIPHVIIVFTIKR